MDHKRIEAAVRELLEAVGENPDREGLRETPQRVARMYEEIFAGKEENPALHLRKTFAAQFNACILEKGITFYSLCEHHLMPFFGKAYVAYVPDGRVVGLSKLARCVEGFARRPQLQERLTAQIADALMEELAPKGVMVLLEAEHLCMTMRGIKKPGSKTVTYVTRGCFTEETRLQEQFFSLYR